MNCYSILKNFIVTAIGIAQDKRFLNVNDKLSDIFDNINNEYASITIHHLLTNTTGIANGFLFETDRYTYDEKDWLQLCLNTPLVYAPGTVFSYSNSNYYLLSCIIRRVTGKRLDVYLRENLFNKLNINSYAWEMCPKDEAIGATGLFLHTSDMIKLGVMYLNSGEGIVSSNWINQATSYQSDSPSPSYSYSFGVNDYGFTCSGSFGQSIIVLPKHKFVFAAHGCTDYNYFEMIKKVFNL